MRYYNISLDILWRTSDVCYVIDVRVVMWLLTNFYFEGELTSRSHLKNL